MRSGESWPCELARPYSLIQNGEEAADAVILDHNAGQDLQFSIDALSLGM